MWTEIKIKNWQDFIDLIEQSKQHNQTLPSWYFRGQSVVDFTLLPSITRIIKGNQINLKKALGIELDLFRTFHSRYELYKNLPTEIKNLKTISFFAEMQHYSCPTRLLDWTTSPYVALHFASEKDFEKDGAIFYFHSDILDEINKSHFSTLSEDLVFENKDKPAIYPFLKARENERILAQQGVFTISNDIFSDHYDLIKNTFKIDNLKDYAIKIIIPKELKIEFLSRLRIMNINDLTLFPGLDGVGKDAGKIALIRVKYKN